MDPLLIFGTFTFGLTLGSFISLIVLRHQERALIDSFFDTVGIRRKEFTKLKDQHDKLRDEVEQLKGNV